MNSIETDGHPATFDDHEESWFAKGETKRSAILPPEPVWAPGVDDSIADAWFR